jgi:aprataxin
MFNPAALRQYAQISDLSTLPASVLFTHTTRTLTVFDAYPKSQFHFLVMPRISHSMATDKEVVDVDGPSELLSSSQLSSLRTLLKADKAKAKDVLLGLRDDAMRV